MLQPSTAAIVFPQVFPRAATAVSNSSFVWIGCVPVLCSASIGVPDRCSMCSSKPQDCIPWNGCWKHLGTDTNQSEWMGDNEPGNSNLLSFVFRKWWQIQSQIILTISDSISSILTTIPWLQLRHLSVISYRKALLSQCWEVSCQWNTPNIPNKESSPALLVILGFQPMDCSSGLGSQRQNTWCKGWQVPWERTSFLTNFFTF